MKLLYRLELKTINNMNKAIKKPCINTIKKARTNPGPFTILTTISEFAICFRPLLLFLDCLGWLYFLKLYLLL